MKKLILLILVVFVLFPTTADARCHSHKCWETVRLKHKIDRITPYRCGPVQSVKPCWVIQQESSMCGYWRALNGCHGYDGRIPCATQACGLYQFLGWRVPWPVIIPGNKLETLRRKLAHHEQAASMSLSNW